MSQGKIKTLYSDKQKTEPLYPKTKLNAISDENGVGLEAIMQGLAYTDGLSQNASVPLTDADSLGGRPASEYATELYVKQKIAEASAGEIDLSDYALKTDVTKEIEKIDFPVDSVNGKTGEVTLTPDDIGAAPAGDYITKHSTARLNGTVLGPTKPPSDGSHHGGYMDFHFDGTETGADGYTSRIIEWAPGDSTLERRGIDIVSPRLMHNHVDLSDLYAPKNKKVINHHLGSPGWYRVGFLYENTSGITSAITRMYINGSYNVASHAPKIIDICTHYHGAYMKEVFDEVYPTTVTKVRLCRVESKKIAIEIYYALSGGNAVAISFQEDNLINKVEVLENYALQSAVEGTLLATLDLNKVNTTRYDLLWTNANPGAAFPAQSINLDLSKYDCVEVSGCVGELPSPFFSSGKIPIGQSGYLSTFGIDFWLHARQFMTSTAGIEFTAGYMKDLGSGTVYEKWNGRSVPYKIYGIREA